MKAYKELNRDELLELAGKLNKEYADAKGKGLNLNMARGKPSPQQLDLSMGVLDAVNADSDLRSQDGTDCRNYGVMDGLPEAKKLLADMIGTRPENMIVCGNASLPLMYDMISHSMTHGVCGAAPWCRQDKLKFLCPAPGYDRHFAITEYFGIEMITIPLLHDGPDMDLVEQYVNSDSSVKGIWCVPKYSNPSGISYSDEVVKRFAALQPAAKDFRIYWDNAYAVHHMYEDNQAQILDILSECDKAGNPDMVFEFCSTSKVTFAGAGIAGVASSPANLEWMKESMTLQTIGYDKINQLRHVRYFKDIEGLREHMKNQAAVIRPKFETVISIFERELTGLDIGTWTNPLGGYFISFDAMEGCAKEIVAKCKEAGMVLTGAGATYPYKNDPKDSNIRIAPSFPTLDEMKQATELFVLCVKLVSVEKLLADEKGDLAIA